MKSNVEAILTIAWTKSNCCIYYWNGYHQKGAESVTEVQILKDIINVSICTNVLRNSMDVSVLSLAMDKYQRKLCSLALLRQPDKKNENSELKTPEFHLK